MKKLLFVCKPGQDHFLRSIIENLKGHYAVALCTSTNFDDITAAVKMSDVVWLEWGDDLTGVLTQNVDILKEKKVVVRIHSYEVFSGMIDQINYRVVDRVIVVSEFMRRLIEYRVPSSIPIAVIPNGIDLDRWSLKVPSNNRLNIGFVANINHKKGVPLLLQFAKRLSLENAQFKLYIAGQYQDERFRLYMTHMVKEMRLTGRVIFDGYVENMDEWMNKIDHLISTSPFESQGMGIVEAMAKGIEPLIHHFPGADELYPYGLLWVEIEDAVARVLETSKFKGHELRNYIDREFNVRKTTKRIQEEIESIIDPPKDVKQGKATISACLMVKNEEDNLECCLKSIDPFVDEIVIVDTGSTDRTMEIAARFGARVYERPWENNFSLHRNQSIEYAKGDWVIIIDADEELVLPWDKKSVLSEALAQIPNSYSAVQVTLKDIQKGDVVMSYNSPRIFRRELVHYENIVHNKPKWEGGVGLMNGVELRHYGYDLSPEKMAQKRDRTMGLLQKRLQEDPNDVEVYYYLSQMYGLQGDLEKTVECAKNYIDKRSSLSYFNKGIYYTIVQSLVIMEQFDEAKLYLDKALEEIPNDIDICYITMELGSQIQDMDLVRTGSTGFIREYKKIEQNPALMGGRFIFNFNKKAFTACLSHMALLSMVEGLKYIGQVEDILKNEESLDSEFKTVMARHLVDGLKECGIQISQMEDKNGYE